MSERHDKREHIDQGAYNSTDIGMAMVWLTRAVLELAATIEATGFVKRTESVSGSKHDPA